MTRASARPRGRSARARRGGRRSLAGPLVRAGIVAVACAFAASPAPARTLWSAADSRQTVVLRSALEGTGLVSAPRFGSGSPRDWQGLGFARLRLDAQYESPAGITGEIAYDNRLSLNTAASFASSSALPSSAPAPFRIRQLGGNVLSRGRTLDYHELDRASLAYAKDRLKLAAGRQAIGWGRGVLFSAVDVFAPFTPLEIDREWRRGVDGLTADFELSKSSSVGLVSAWGPSWGESALGGRLRGFVGQADAELLVAKRAEDQMYALTASAAAGGAELHAEAALFHTPGDVPGDDFAGNRDLVAKAVLGASNNFLVGSGLKATLEYHYSGFGAARPAGLPALLANPAFVRRVVRGDTQILGRQAAALLGDYTLSQEWETSVELLQSLVDPSGVVVASGVWSLAENATLSGTAYLAYGPGPLGSAPRSQFGSIPPTLLLQLRLYD